MRRREEQRDTRRPARIRRRDVRESLALRKECRPQLCASPTPVSAASNKSIIGQRRRIRDTDLGALAAATA